MLRSFSTDPAIRLSQPPRSGKSIKASSSPITQKMCMCVKRVMNPSTATIRLQLVGLVRDAFGQRIQVEKHQDVRLTRESPGPTPREHIGLVRRAIMVRNSLPPVASG